jgi:hypothetical protein
LEIILRGLSRPRLTDTELLAKVMGLGFAPLLLHITLYCEPIFDFLTLRRICSILSVRIATDYQIHDFDVSSIGFETRCPVRAKTLVELQHFRTCYDDGAKRPIKAECFFIADIPAAT